MTEYVEREKVDNWLLTESVSLDTQVDREYVVGRLREEIQAADVRPVVKAVWEEFGDGEQKFYSCSKCFATHYRWDNFCPNCGAMMEES